MKFLTLIVLALGITFGASAQYKKAAVQATGLTCAMCSNATLKSLETLSFVDKIDTDLENTTFILYFKPGAAVDIDAIKNKVEDAGFSVGKLVITANFDQTEVKNDTHVPFAGSTLHFMHVKDQVLKGDQNLTVIDKDFVSTKQYKKYATETSMACYKTGMMGDCCHSGNKASNRVYHVTI
ncbi:heavy-metal-associated domain-containing protein [Chitinophaga sp. Cy-1792]|uniref:heavy-metal-associated domain-containing protein n=1 Tax=Chitinophaga sp. Cy-1792 TaxID=2608339 RepID=UPI001423EE8A|nr:heavy-metal-associated domain-containing protein [Chitinophaga sp. Cy-1792]NIG53471.1 heavy-metal-associated domain-containing protein [Chitinophaga sp. Cy-1792]